MKRRVMSWFNHGRPQGDQRLAELLICLAKPALVPHRCIDISCPNGATCTGEHGEQDQGNITMDCRSGDVGLAPWGSGNSDEEFSGFRRPQSSKMPCTGTTRYVNILRPYFMSKVVTHTPIPDGGCLFLPSLSGRCLLGVGTV